MRTLPRGADTRLLGVFTFQTGCWSLVQDWVWTDMKSQLKGIAGAIPAVPELGQVSYTAKNGPEAGQLIEYVKPTLLVRGPYSSSAASSLSSLPSISPE
jgi:hypothetical protein